MLTEVADGILAWIAADPGFGRPNSAAIVDADGLTIVDAGVAPSEIEPFATALVETGLPIRRLVYTSSHIEYVGGSTRFRLAAVYGSPEISAHLDQPPNTAGYRHLLPHLAAEFEELTTRPVTHTVREGAWISPRAVAVPTAGQIGENLVVQVPDANVVLTGAMGAFGVVPVGFGGDPATWVESLDQVLEWGTTVVPGHGPVGGRAEVETQQAYLSACVLAAGDPTHLGRGPWSEWPGQEFHAPNIERAAMLAAGDPAPPPSILRLMGLG